MNACGNGYSELPELYSSLQLQMQFRNNGKMVTASSPHVQKWKTRTGLDPEN